MTRILQVNLNHARQAQNLLMQVMSEKEVGIAIVLNNRIELLNIRIGLPILVKQPRYIGDP